MTESESLINDNIATLDQKVSTILEFLGTSQSKAGDNNTKQFSSLFQENMDDEKREKSNYSRLRRKQRIYQAVPINIDSLSEDSLNKLRDIFQSALPKTMQVQAKAVKKEASFGWVPDLLKVLGTLATGLGVFELLKDLITGGEKGKIIEAVKDAAQAAEKASEAAAKASEMVPKKPVTRVTDPLTEAIRNGEPIKVTIDRKSVV